MKRINLIIGFSFLVLAVLSTIDIVWHYNRGDYVSVTSIVVLVGIYIVAGIYLDLGFTSDRRRSNRINECIARYKQLVLDYDKLTDSKELQEKSAKMQFIIRVQEFGEVCFDILTSSYYSEEQKMETREKLDDILQKVKNLE